MIQLSAYIFAAFTLLLTLTGGIARRARPLSGAALGLHVVTLTMIALAFFAPGIFFDARTYLGDLWTAFDAIGKTAAGARSSIDYFNPIGPVYEWGFRAALLIAPPSAATLPVANAVVGALTLAATFVALRGRASPLGVAVAGMVAVAAAVSPRELDTLFVRNEASFLAPYNRWGWALLVPAVAYFALPARKDAASAIGAAVVGVLIAALWLLKPTYGAAAVGMAVVAAVLQPKARRDAALAIGAALLALGVAQLLTGQVSAYMADLARTSELTGSLLRPYKLLNQVAEPMMVLAVSVILMLSTATAPGLRARLRASAIGLLSLTAAAGAGWVVLMQNHHVTEAAPYLLIPMLALEWTRTTRDAPAEAAPPPPQLASIRLGLIALALLYVLERPILDGGHLLAQQVQLAQTARTPALQAGRMTDLVVQPRFLFPGHSPSESVRHDQTRMLTGMSLLRAHGADAPGAGAVAALNFSNPFPFALGATPPLGTPIWTHFDRSISAEVRPDPEVFFDGVDYVMIAKNEPNGRGLAVVYADTLAADFREVAGDDYWRLFLRRDIRG